MKLSLLLACVALTTPALAQTSGPAVPSIPTSKFDWKLRLTKGQRWTQTIQSVSRTGGIGGGNPGFGFPYETTTTRTITLQNEVLDVTPTGALVRTTFKNLDSTTKALPEKLFASSYTSPSLLPALAGGSFTWRQSPIGQVSEVKGVEDLIVRQKSAVATLAKTPAELTDFGSKVFKPNDLRTFLTELQTIALPSTPLSIGGTYSYTFPFPVVQVGKLKIRRTLRAFDPQSAVLDENATLGHRSSYSVSRALARGKIVTLTRDAAQLFLKVNHRVSSTATPAYLSKNGRIYYRNAQKPTEVIWLDAPEYGIYLTQKEAAPYTHMRGYNNSKNGRTLAEAINENKFDFEAARAVKASPLRKSFTAIQGTTSGQTIVSPATGLISQSQVSIRLHGRNTLADQDGRNTTPFWMSIQTTISSQPDEATVPVLP